MKKCAVYEYIGGYGHGLVFVPLEYEEDWVSVEKWHYSYRVRNFSNQWKRLGEMEIDEKVISFKKEGNHANSDSPLHQKEILIAEYYYAE